MSKIEIKPKVAWRLPFLPERPQMCFFGQGGTGKSCGSMKIMQHLSKQYKIVIIDVKKEYDNIKELKKSDMRKRGFIRRARTVKLSNGKIIREPRKVAQIIAGLLLNYKNTILVLEEVHRIIKEGESLKNDEIYNIGTTLFEGRANGNSIIAISQRPHDCNKALVDESKETFVWHVKPRIHEYMCNLIGETIPFDQMNEFEFFSEKHGRIFRKFAITKKTKK